MPRHPLRPSTAQHAMPRHSAQRWAWAGASLGLVLGLISQAPAYWLTQAVAQASQARVLLQDPQGTVWQGSALWVLNEGPLNSAASTRTALPSRLQWQLTPHMDWAELRLSMRATLSSACCTPQAVRIDVSPRWRGVHLSVSDHTSQWPAAWLVGLGAPWNTVQPEGLLQLQTHGLQWTQQANGEQLQGQAELQLQQFSTRLSTLRPLGNYRVVVQGGHSTTLRLDTLEGSLKLQGSGQLVRGHLSFSGEASAAPGSEAVLSNLLNILGQRQGNKSILKMG